ncbi:unnamed protein product [Urochloa humidicola]
MRIWSAMDMEMLSVRWDSSRCVKERVRQSAKEPKIRNETYLPKIGKETYLLVMVDRPILGSQDYNAIMYYLKKLFEKVEATKPMASRSTHIC